MFLVFAREVSYMKLKYKIAAKKNGNKWNIAVNDYETARSMHSINDSATAYTAANVAVSLTSFSGFIFARIKGRSNLLSSGMIADSAVSVSSKEAWHCCHP
jgi:hypothetical protein